MRYRNGVESAAGGFVVPADLGKEAAVLVHVTWEFVDTSEDGIRRSLGIFSRWQPPAGAEFEGFYGFADGSWGVALIEDSSAIAGEAVAFRDSVG